MKSSYFNQPDDSDDGKLSTTDMCSLAPLQVRERVVMNIVLYGFPIRNVWWKF